MKIGISTSVIQRGRTGIAQYLFALLKTLPASAGEDQFTLFVLEEDQPLFAGLEGPYAIVPVAEQFRPPIKNIIWHQVELPGICSQLGIDVLHVPSYRRLLWSSPCPRVATIHDLAPFHVRGKYDLARMIYGRFVVKSLARKQEKIIAVSQNTAADIRRFFQVPASKIRVIYNGLDHDRFRPMDRVASTKFALENFKLNRPFFLYVARLEHPGKNHVRLIEAFENFKDRTKSEWLLAFGGSDWHGAEVIHERIRSSRWRDSIKSLGFVKDEDLPKLYSSARAFVYPSLFEGFGMPPVEAMACGCPVISSARGSLGEVVGDAAKIVDPENVEEIAGALELLHDDLGLVDSLVAAGKKRAATFSWEKAAEETRQVYRAAYSKGKNPVSKTFQNPPISMIANAPDQMIPK